MPVMVTRTKRKIMRATTIPNMITAVTITVLIMTTTTVTTMITTIIITSIVVTSITTAIPMLMKTNKPPKPRRGRQTEASEQKLADISFERTIGR